MSGKNCGPILVVDDDPDILEIVSLVLEGNGFRVVTARGGAEALRLLGTGDEAPGLILLDLMMPGIDGGQVLATMREQKRSTANVVVLSCAGDAAARAAGLGGVEYIPKPIDLDRLVHLAARFCEPSARAPSE
jgi:DNA-binding response OmpR family regulator